MLLARTTGRVIGVPGARKKCSHRPHAIPASVVAGGHWLLLELNLRVVVDRLFER